MSSQSWFSRMLDAFTALFKSGDSANGKSKNPIKTSTKVRHVAGHWPVYIELSKSTREAHPPRDDSAFTLRFSASDAPLLQSLKINSREFNGSYVPEKKSFVVQVPERLVQELMRNQDNATYVEGFMDGGTLGSRRFTIPLQF